MTPRQPRSAGSPDAPPCCPEHLWRNPCAAAWAMLVPLLAILTALVMGGVLIIVTDLEVISAFTRIPRLVADPFTDPTGEISLQEALWYHPQRGHRGRFVAVDGTTRSCGRDGRAIRTRRSALEDARTLYPELGPGVTIYLTSSKSPRRAERGLAVGEHGLWRTVRRLIGQPVRRWWRPSAPGSRGDPSLLPQAFYPLTESLVTATPYILVGLAVALGFRAGLFNIGAEGQYFSAAWLRFLWATASRGCRYLHPPAADACWPGWWAAGCGAPFPGCCKATTGAHEVINTIMMNYIAFALSDWLLNGPMKRPGGFRPISPEIQPSALLPKLFPGSHPACTPGSLWRWRCAALVYWLLFKTTIGFELRTVGANPTRRALCRDQPHAELCAGHVPQRRAGRAWRRPTTSSG